MASQNTANPQTGDQKAEQSPHPPKLAYMHSPPRIMPNYGNKKRSLLPKTKVSRVLLYDNITQQQMLDMKLSHIRLERNRASRLLDLHRKSFIYKRRKRQHQLQQAGITLPDINKRNTNSSLERMVTNNSKSPRDLFGRNRSAFSVDIDNLKLPEIANAGHVTEVNPRVIFKLKDSDGTTQIFHTIDEGGLFSEFVPRHKFYNSTTEDPRFMGLEDSLTKTDISDGFNDLSPSYRKEYPKLPEHLEEYIQNINLST